MVGNIISVPKPLTTSQEEMLKEYRERSNGVGRPLTDKQKIVWHNLETKLAESKVYKLSETAKKILSNTVFYEKFGRKKRLETKYFDNGLLTEKNGRDLLSEVLGTPLVEDNERKQNEWVTGKRDVKSNIIIDIKSCYSFETFNNHLTENASELYLRQLDCYMDLWRVKDSLLAYVLVDTPHHIINDELRRLDWKKDIFDINGDVREDKIDIVKQVIKEFIYTEMGLDEYCQQSTTIHKEWFEDFIEIPKEERVHLVSHSFDKIRIEQRNESIKVAREYMNKCIPLNNKSEIDLFILK